jgi:hypothetical protein
MGRAARIDALGLRARLNLNDISDRFATQLQPTLYGGGGGLDGASELKGLPKPVSLGRRYNVTPVFLGNVDLGQGALPTYQTNWREIAGHDAVRIRGVEQTRVGSAPGIGQWTDFVALGCFQLGSSPDGPVTCDVRGDAPSQRYARSLTDAIRTVLTALGPALSDSDFDAQSWFDVGPRLAAEIGWGVGAEQVSAGDALRELLASAGAWLYGTRAGKLGVALVGSPAATAHLTLTLADILDLKSEPLPASLQPTPQAVEIRSARNWTLLDDVAGSVDAAARAALASPGRFERAFSNAIAARSIGVRTMRIEGLYAAAADAAARAADLRSWLERGLRMLTITTDRYLGQVELGMTANVTYPYDGLSGGWSGIVVAWREKIGARRLELTVIG